MLNYPVVIIPPKVEAWRVDGACRDYLVLGSGQLPSRQAALMLLGFQGSGILGGKYVKDVEDARRVLAGCHDAESVRQLMS